MSLELCLDLLDGALKLVSIITALYALRDSLKQARDKKNHRDR